MAYEPNEWACGDIITATKMNAMERGIADMNAEYVPNEWSSGETITAEKLNHMEQGIANGGGECDLSTATVTIVGETQSVSDWGLRNSYFPYVANDELLITPIVEMGTYSAVLYKNSLKLTSYFTPSVEGDASVVQEGRDVYVMITGNCTITVPETA